MSKNKPNKRLTRVELHPAYSWDCPECGVMQFSRAIVAEITPEDQEDLAERYGGEAEEYLTGHWMSKPDEVICSACGCQFETVDWNEE